MPTSSLPLLILFFLFPAFICAEDTITRKQLNDEAIPGWQFLRESISNVEVSYTETIETLQPDGTRSTIVIEHNFSISQSLNCAKNIRHRVDKPGLEDVEGHNPDYSFRITRPFEGVEYEKKLLLASNDLHKTFDELNSNFNLGFVASGYLVSPFNCFEILKNNDFQILRSEKQLSGDIKVDLIWTPENIKEGTLWQLTFSPGNSWAIKQAITLHPQGDTRISITYQKLNTGEIIPKLVKEEQMAHGDPNSIIKRHTVEFGIPRKCTDLPHSFYLSAYGLMEPEKGTIPSSESTK